MPISLEALAMSGADYVGFDLEEWEKMESEVPPYLLADEEEEDKEMKQKINGYDDCEGKDKYGKVEEFVKERNDLSFGIIIIWTILLMRKYWKARSSLTSTIPWNSVFAYILALIIHGCL